MDPPPPGFSTTVHRCTVVNNPGWRIVEIFRQILLRGVGGTGIVEKSTVIP